jgi:hypothetical protein
MDNGKPLLGWREWVALPNLGIPRIKAKVDTGARTSALHAFSVERFQENGRPKVRFLVHPVQRDTRARIECVAELADERLVADSGGHREMRPVIMADVLIGGVSLPIELTLTSRDTMAFRMLLGRTAMRDRYLVDPGRSYLSGGPEGGGD